MSTTAILLTAIFGGFVGLAITGWLVHRAEQHTVVLVALRTPPRVPESPEVRDHAWTQLTRAVNQGRADFGGEQ